MIQLIVFLPLAGFLIAGVFGRQLGARGAEIATTTLLFVSALLSWVVFTQVAATDARESVQVLATWFHVGRLQVDWAFRVDTLTGVMLVVVTTVSALVHLYSIGYMHEDPSRQRFFCYLSLFTFTMLMLVTADNLVQMFFGWEGVGLASYLLIGFWYEKPSANAAAIKAFVVNRVGDFGFLLGIFALYMLTHSVAFDAIFAAAPGLANKTVHIFGADYDGLTITCLLLFMGAMGKSAQFLLHTWLPDAMEGPTPVSALIHAATMVTAGVFMVARLSPVFALAPNALGFVTVVGATTCFFAATVALVQTDIKRVIAYSTCSQLGYMFVALGVGGSSLAMFHLFTHAFFKALLFLGAGSVIHAMHHEQDMRRMGGLRRAVPFTFAMMTIGTLALTGFPFTAGYYSKDAIIEAAYAAALTKPSAVFGFLSTLLVAGLTSFYSWRLVFMTFFGERASNHPPDDHGEAPHGSHAEQHDREHEPHESPLVMLIPLGVLALGSLVAGFLFKDVFIGHAAEGFWKGSLLLHEEPEAPGVVALLPTLMLAGGFFVALYMYILSPGSAARLAADHRYVYAFLWNKWYIDEIYDIVFVRPAFIVGRLFWKGGDGGVIDRFGPDGIAARVLAVTNQAVRLQTGYVYNYAFAMLIGVAAAISWFLVSGLR